MTRQSCSSDYDANRTWAGRSYAQNAPTWGHSPFFCYHGMAATERNNLVEDAVDLLLSKAFRRWPSVGKFQLFILLL